MSQTFLKLYSIIEPQNRLRLAIVMFLMIVAALAQVGGIASIMPFLSVLANPSVIHTNHWLSQSFVILDFRSDREFLYFLGIGAFIIFMLGTFIQAFTQWVITRFSYSQQYYLSRRLLASYLRRPYTFFVTRNSSDLATTVLQETHSAITLAFLPAMRLISFVLLAATIILLLVVLEPWLSISFAAILGAIYSLISLFADNWLKRIGTDRLTANQERFKAVSEVLSGVKEIRLLGRELDYMERFRNPSKRVVNHQANMSILQDLPQYAIEAIAFGGVLLIVLYLMNGENGLDRALPIIGLYALAGKQLIPAFHKIFAALTTIQFNMPAVDRILEDLSTSDAAIAPPPMSNQNQMDLAPRNEILLSDITYRYPENDHPALNHLCVRIPAHTTVGFVGSSGAGKSTLIDVILGLLEPEVGEIYVDGTPLNPHNVRTWQMGIGYVPQHIFLADQSVAANIALGVPKDKIDHAAVQRASRLANLHDFVIKEMPMGYDTLVGERGVRLSGGQRQRIGIARALYRNPPVLLFDEATSALDNATERVVMEAIHHLSGEKTIILVAHRLSTVKPCHRIFLLDRGQIIDEGTWAELIKNSIPFKHLAVGTTD